MPAGRQIRDLMACMASFSVLDEDALKERVRKTNEDPPRVSIYDVLQAVAGVEPHNCANVWRRLLDAYPEVNTRCIHFKFPGQGQRETPVTDARGIVTIIMLLPGRAAARFRKASADVVVRYLGGDGSLVEEIAANRLAQESLPEEDPARFFAQTVESEAVKRKREELSLADLEAQVKAAKRRCIEDGLASLQRCGLPVDDRDRMRAKDCLNQITFGKEQGESSQVDPELCIRHFLQQRGIRDASMDCRLGKAAKKLYLADHPDYSFPRKDIYVNGQILQANIWHDSQRSYLERALAGLLGS